MIQLVFKLAHEGVKAAAPHVARHVQRVAPLLVPNLAKGAVSAGAVGSAAGLGHRVGRASAGSAPRMPVKTPATPKPHVTPKPHPAPSGTTGKIERLAEGIALDVAAGEAASRGIKKVGEMARKDGRKPAAPPAAA
jgi:hypothetical protein